MKTIIRADTAGILLMARGPYLAWLSLTFLDELPGLFLRPLPIAFDRYRYQTGFVAHRSAEDLPPFKRLEAIVRETALAGLRRRGGDPAKRGASRVLTRSRATGILPLATLFGDGRPRTRTCRGDTGRRRVRSHHHGGLNPWIENVTKPD